MAAPHRSLQSPRADSREKDDLSPYWDEGFVRVRRTRSNESTRKKGGMTELKVRRVVSNFIFHTDAQGCERLLLLRRSSRVRNYQGLWCTVSGSRAETDDSALACAMREIQEETGLRGGHGGVGAEEEEEEEDDLTLIHEGSEMVVDAADRGIAWHVTPFLWRSRRRDVRLDWEHTEYRWILPEKLASHDLVPDLVRTYEHVSRECR